MKRRNEIRRPTAQEVKRDAELESAMHRAWKNERRFNEYHDVTTRAMRDLASTFIRWDKARDSMAKRWAKEDGRTPSAEQG